MITCVFNVMKPTLSCMNRLGSHLSPSGTECYITSDMFYVEVQLDASGQLVDVKVAHQGENPTVSLLTSISIVKLVVVFTRIVYYS